MGDPIPSVPWNTPTLWTEANASLARSAAGNRHRLTDAYQTADRLRDLLLSIFPIMDDLCQQTCPDCTDICCQHAWVWADFRDLLFWHLAGIPVPDHQPLSRRGEHCCYTSSRGCRLERLQRPFVCTWYICPAQTRLLQGHPEQQARLSAVLQQTKDERRQMEDQFIQAVSG
jgi:hypothetical protein